MVNMYIWYEQGRRKNNAATTTSAGKKWIKEGGEEELLLLLLSRNRFNKIYNRVRRRRITIKITRRYITQSYYAKEAGNAQNSKKIWYQDVHLIVSRKNRGEVFVRLRCLWCLLVLLWLLVLLLAFVWNSTTYHSDK